MKKKSQKRKQNKKKTEKKNEEKNEDGGLSCFFSINLSLCTNKNGCFEISTCAHWYVPVRGRRVTG